MCAHTFLLEEGLAALGDLTAQLQRVVAPEDLAPVLSCSAPLNDRIRRAGDIASLDRLTLQRTATADWPVLHGFCGWTAREFRFRLCRQSDGRYEFEAFFGDHRSFRRGAERSLTLKGVSKNELLPLLNEHVLSQNYFLSGHLEQDALEELAVSGA